MLIGADRHGGGGGDGRGPGRRRPIPGPHGFSEILYAFSSTANNNGSAFAGLNANTPFYNIATGLAMLIGRFLAA